MARQSKTVRVTRTPDEPGDLCGVLEAAALLGCERTRIPRWVRNGQMPKPISELAATKVWYRSELEAFKQEREKGK